MGEGDGMLVGGRGGGGGGGLSDKLALGAQCARTATEYTSLSNEELTSTIREISTSSPNAGERYVIGSLRTRGIRIQR